MNEAETRTKIIDRRLALAGWNVADLTQVILELPINAAHAGGTGSEFADHVLLLHGEVVAKSQNHATDVELSLPKPPAPAATIPSIEGVSA